MRAAFDLIGMYYPNTANMQIFSIGCDKSPQCTPPSPPPPPSSPAAPLTGHSFGSSTSRSTLAAPAHSSMSLPFQQAIKVKNRKGLRISALSAVEEKPVICERACDWSCAWSGMLPFLSGECVVAVAFVAFLDL